VSGPAAQSFLCRVDARVKLALALAAASAVTLPMAPLAVACAGLTAVLAAGRLLPVAGATLRRGLPFMALMFALDWLLIDFEFAVVITMRLALLSTAFLIVSATTAPEALCVALERLGLERRIAFTLATAFRSTTLLADEWRGIVEAQRARGIVPPRFSWRRVHELATYASALIVPAIVLATQRAWALSEAAAVRGIETPRRSVAEGSGSSELSRAGTGEPSWERRGLSADRDRVPVEAANRS
jgi:energy-coupling factor transporter transmembrane protein EcfT